MNVISPLYSEPKKPASKRRRVAWWAAALVVLVASVFAWNWLTSPRYSYSPDDSSYSQPTPADEADPYSPDNPDYSVTGADPSAADELDDSKKAEVYAALKERMADTELSPEDYPDDESWNDSQDRLDNQVFQEVADEYGVTFRQAEDIWMEYEVGQP